MMEYAKVFQTGRSQAVRLPKAYRFNGTEVVIKAFGNGVLLLPQENPWLVMEQALTEFEPDMLLERHQGEQLPRELL